MDILLYEFCGNESFLNNSVLYQDLPTLPHCFQDTLPVWISCGYLWLMSAPFTVFMFRTRRAALPYSILHIVKLALCLFLACLAQLHFTFRQMYGDKCTGNQLLPFSAQTAMWIKFVTYICAAVLLQIQRSCGVKTSGVPFTFWLFILVAESCRLYSYVLENVVCGTQIVFFVYYFSIVAQLVLYCWSERDLKQNPNKIFCPMDDASVLNRILYHWLTPTIYAVYKKRFIRDSMWLQTYTIRSSVVGPRLFRYWHTRLKHYLQRTISFRKSFMSVEGKDDMSTSFTESTPLLHQGEPGTDTEKHESDKHQVAIFLNLQKRSVVHSIAKYRQTGSVNDLLRQPPQKVTRPSLLMTVLRTFIWELCEFLGYGMCSFCFWFLIPIVLRLLLDYIEMKTNPDVDPVSAWVGVVYVAGLCVIIEVSSITSQTTIHHSTSFGLKIKSALMYLIYKKALTVARTHQTMSVGEVSSLMSVDCQRIQDSTMFLYYILLFGFVIAGFTWQVTDIVGVPATVGGLLMLVVFAPITVYIGYRQNILQTHILHLKGLRIRLINEVLTGIKVLKMYTWEPTFQQKIEDIRQKETDLLRTNTILLAIVTTVANHAQFLVHFVMITVYVVVSEDHYISSSVVFVSLSLVIFIKYVVTWLPTVLSGAVQV